MTTAYGGITELEIHPGFTTDDRRLGGEYEHTARAFGLDTEDTDEACDRRALPARLASFVPLRRKKKTLSRDAHPRRTYGGFAPELTLRSGLRKRERRAKRARATFAHPSRLFRAFGRLERSTVDGAAALFIDGISYDPSRLQRIEGLAKETHLGK